MIYFFKLGLHPYVKVGVSSDVTARLNHLQGATPFPLVVLGVFDGDVSVERLCHDALSPFKVRNEWFDAAPAAALCERAKAVGILAAANEIVADRAARTAPPLSKAEAQQVTAAVFSKARRAFGGPELARLIGCDEKTLYLICKGRSLPKLSTVVNLLAVDPTALDPFLARVDRKSEPAPGLEQARDAIEAQLRRLAVRAA